MDQIIEKAKQAMRKSYSPYSNFKVGACIEGDNGKFYMGCNVESVSYTPTICAERNALTSAVLDGCQSFKRIAVVCSGEDYPFPCGVCRQMLSEFGYDMEVIIVKKSGDVIRRPLNELLPYAFTEIS